MTGEEVSPKGAHPPGRLTAPCRSRHTRAL